MTTEQRVALGIAGALRCGDADIAVEVGRLLAMLLSRKVEVSDVIECATCGMPVTDELEHSHAPIWLGDWSGGPK